MPELDAEHARARFERASDILADCLERDPSERAAFIADATAGDADLEVLVSELLGSATLEDTFLDGGLQGAQVRQVASALIDSAPHGGSGDREADRVAGYEIVEALGAGGFGTVWLARQLAPVRREVALKVLKQGMDTREIVARFEQERQALARMSHENVARVLDAGVTESGRPFFAMELVRGRPITKHCDDEHLDVRARLRLFVEACRGVQHAHQRGIIHRDLKPSNVLVAREDGRSIPKVIDFGIAKAIEGDPEDRLVRTQHGDVLGTPAYMSPEQATPGATADTRTDVYSLGVLLHELLTGTLPSDTLRRRAIRGDLDWIVTTAIESEPDRRYPSVDALVADIERHLDDLPVEARPPSAIYRLGKFTRKHRFGVAAAAVAVVLLVAGLLGTSYGLAAANHARGIAEERTARAEEQVYRGSMLLAEQAIRSRRLDAARVLLDDAPKDLRGWEWSHLAGRLAPDVAVLVPPGLDIQLGCVARDSSRLWAWDRTRMSRWHAGMSRAEASIEVPAFRAGWFFEEVDGAILAMSDDEVGHLKRVVVDGPSRGIVDLPPIEPPIYGACHDASTARLFWSDAAGAMLSRLADGGPIQRGPTLPSVSDRNSIVTHDGRRLITHGRQDLEVIDAASLAVVHAMTWPASRELSRIALSPDDSLLAMGYSDGSVELHELRPSGPILRTTLATDPAWVSALAFSSDGRFLAAGFGGGTVRTWAVASGELHDALALAGDSVYSVAFLGSRLMFAPSYRGLLSWRPSADEHRRLRGHASYVYSVAVLDGGSLAVSGGWDPRGGAPGGLKFWDVPSRRLVASWGDDKELFVAVAPSPDGTRIWAAAQRYPDSWVVVIDVRTGEITAIFPIGATSVSNVVALDARRAVVVTGGGVNGRGGEAILFDAETGLSRQVTDPEQERSEANSALAVSPDGRWLAMSWRRGGIQLFDARTLARVERREAHDAATWSLAFSPDGQRIVSASDDGTIAIWIIPSLELVHRLRGSGSPVMCAAFSPDGSRIATGTRDGGVELWDPARALLVGRLTGHASYVKSVAWTPDGRTLLSASGDHDVRVWDLMSGEDVAAAAAERNGLLARFEPMASEEISGRLDGMSPRERQVARQVLLRRGLDAPGEKGTR